MSDGYIALNILMNGPGGVLVPLFFENFLDAATATMMYNYVACILLILIAATAGTRSEPAYCVIIPIFAGVFMLFGWLKFPNQLNAVAMLVVTTIFGIMIYMNETNHEVNGIAGPGSKMLNIVMIVILFQAALGIMPTLGIFDPSATATTSYGQPYCPPSATCGDYSNVDISASTSSVSDGGGMLSGAVDMLVGAVMAFVATCIFVVTLIVNVLLSATVITNLIAGLYPGVTGTGVYLAFMGIISLVFWACDIIFIMNVYMKLFPSEGSI